LALQGIKYEEFTGLEKIVLYEKYRQDRMAKVLELSASVLASVDPKKAGETLSEFMDMLFPEVAISKEAQAEARMRELREFSKKEVKLVHGKRGAKLSIKDR